MPTIRSFGHIEEIGRIEEQQLSVQWRIMQFLRLSIDPNVRYRSPRFGVGKEQWCFELYPSWQRKKQFPSTGRLELYIVRCDRGSAAPATFNITVGLKGTAGIENRREVEREFSDSDDYHWRNFCPRSKLLKHKEKLIPGGMITITCVLKRVIAPVAAGSGEKALEDFAKLLTTGENSDVTVQVGDVEFKGHKAILSARCSVLSAMFRHETGERLTNRIKIEDCEPEVFRDFLQYLYVGSVQSLSEQNVFGLYRIADMYLASDLKQLCSEHIRDTLSVQTFCDALRLALTYGESDLLKRAIDFATQNLWLIIRSVEWHTFISEYPREANEVLIKCVRQ